MFIFSIAKTILNSFYRFHSQYRFLYQSMCGCERLCNISSIFTANAKVLKSYLFPDIQNLKNDLKCPFICDKTPKSKYSYIQKRSLNQIVVHTLNLCQISNKYDFNHSLKRQLS